ncbi:dTDP-glucose 4,6-dehydratase [Candidatus Uhrbacteria bacterium CG10_big_fil_rev_8_21_14_0_10_50_16]|uniref:dTDP-glucose 4,6-dehydratase n=1 Tax=Candidatus Uhrbacteria bacterium CG10_big_fil_rev_8_21_14_0_10_50_16 TaxID=1975039 RepID=A0A2H0RMK4_9BACT|nr:MAG: dTDP-glucose 4,6-dehydratase [Candidatus Uhrbacteria bacterium CG10_big_fil_rev_8_21_14_0_10_50_16]
MKLLVTGGAGFIGSNFIHYWLANHADDTIINYDALTYAGNLENLKDVEADPRYTFIKGDIGDYDTARNALEGVDVVVNFAAESHNDRAILDPGLFIRTNVLGTQIFLAAAKDANVKRFHHISTCEVFGDLSLDEERSFKETDAFRPKTPYNASKASANHVVMAYYYTFGLPVTISHCENNYGPYQFPEKLIPLFTSNALEDKPLPLFKSSLNRRPWIHVEDHARAIEAILTKGRVGEAYNIATTVEKSVEQITDVILETLGKPDTLKTYVADRKQHDSRYALDPTKLKQDTGWEPMIDFDEGVRKTILWYKEHPEWWQHCKNGDYQTYYESYYKTLEQ